MVPGVDKGSGSRARLEVESIFGGDKKYKELDRTECKE
jgi:hypothetical protein